MRASVIDLIDLWMLFERTTLIVGLTDICVPKEISYIKVTECGIE